MSANLNKVILIGRISRQPEAFTTQSGISRSNFDVAVQREYRNANGTYDADFLPVVAWRQTADFVNRYLSKGNLVAVEGSIQTRKYDAQDGTKRYVTEIIADSVKSLERRENATGSQPQQRPAQQPVQQEAPAQQTTMDGFTQIDDDSDLPF